MDEPKSMQSVFGMREGHVARRIEYEMEKRGWSQERLAKEMADAGYPIHQSAISKIVNPREGKRRTIGVDEAIGFARVFGTSLDSLALPLLATKSVEVRKLIDEISKLMEQRLLVIEKTSMLWKRLRELLNDSAVVDALVAEFEREGLSRDVALHNIHYWVEGSFIKGDAIDSVHPEEVPNIQNLLAENIDVLRKLREMLTSERPTDVDAFLRAHEPDIVESGLPLAGSVLGVLRRLYRQEDVAPDELALATHWVDITIRTLTDLREEVLAMRKQDGEIETP